MMDNKLIVFSAPSGAGKTTLVKYIIETFSDIEFSISATSRIARGDEKDGVDYYFLSNKEFKARIENEEFIEYEEVYGGKFYGTLKSEVDRIWKANKILKNRLLERGDVSLEEINLRVKKAESELDYASKFDNIIINNDLEESKKIAHTLIKEFIDE